MDPERFGKYRIIRKLAGGGMGRVYLARIGDTPQHAALKLIDLAPDQDSQEVLAAERRGAELQKRLSCVDTRVVRILEAGDREGYFFIAMEYVEGQDLSELFAHGPLAPASAVQIASELCEVLANAHMFRAVLDDRQYYGIIHGDIKPRNIRITPKGGVKLLDFGIAKAISTTRKVTQNQFGSIPYSSPERLRNGEVDASSDLWSVSVMLFEMLTGGRYFQADTALRLEQVIRNYRAVLPTIEKIPEGLRPILTKALSPAPERRYPSADALRSDLESFRIGRPLPASVLVHAAEEESTRRTQRDASDRLETVETEADPESGQTRRTVPGQANGTSSSAVPPPLPNFATRPMSTPAPRPAAVVAPRLRRRMPGPLRVVSAGFTVLAFLFLFSHELNAWRQGHEFERELASDKLTDMDSAWERYEAIASHSFLPVVLAGPRDSLEERLVAVADQVISEYRDSDAPTVRQGDWQRAHDALSHALELRPNDHKVRGRMRVCDGHLLRIVAKGSNAARTLNDAKNRFEEAAKLLPDSPDPHLGLARLYSSGPGLKDAEKAESEMHEAEKRGYRLGRRENNLLADALRDRAEHWVREANQVKGLPQEIDYLHHADDDYGRAIDLYQKIVPFGNASTILRHLMNDREHLQERLSSASQPPAETKGDV